MGKNIDKNDILKNKDDSIKTGKKVVKKKRSNNRGRKKKQKKSKLIIILSILLSIMLVIVLLLILNIFININKMDKKIDEVIQLNNDIVFLESSYDNILKVVEDNNKIYNSNNDYNDKIVNIKKDIENINIKINKLKESK